MTKIVNILRRSSVVCELKRRSTVVCNILRRSSVECSIDMPLMIPAPAFVSAEVGLIDAYTIDILLDRALSESKIPDAADLIIIFSITSDLNSIKCDTNLITSDND